MKNFLVIYGMPAGAMAEMMQNTSKEDMEKGMEEWKAWQEQHKEHIPELGNPVGKNTRVTKDGAEELSNEIAGYSIMQGESKEEVVEVLGSNPHFQVPGGYIEVMEIMPM